MSWSQSENEDTNYHPQPLPLQHHHSQVESRQKEALPGLPGLALSWMDERRNTAVLRTCARS